MCLFHFGLDLVVVVMVIVALYVCFNVSLFFSCLFTMRYERSVRLDGGLHNNGKPLFAGEVRMSVARMTCLDNIDTLTQD